MRATALLLALAAVVAAQAAGQKFQPCANAPAAWQFCNTSLSQAARIADLLRRLSLQDKIGLMGTNAKGVKSLNIDTYQWWSEALHGIGTSLGTDFAPPTPVAVSTHAQ